MPELPNEMFFTVGDNLTCSHTLASLCRVNKRFQAIFTPFLYKIGVTHVHTSVICGKLPEDEIKREIPAHVTNPAHWAIQNNKVHTFELLLLNGLKTDTPLNLIKLNKLKHIEKDLKEEQDAIHHRPNDNLVWNAVKWHHFDIVQLLIQHGASTPLYALREAVNMDEPSADTIKMLLDFKALPETEDNKNEFLWRTVNENRFKSFQILLDCGVGDSIDDVLTWTSLLFIAAIRWQLEMPEVLLELMSAKQILSSRIASEALSKAAKGNLYPSGVGQLHIRDPTKIVPVIELLSKYGATANEAKLHLNGRTLWPLIYKRLASDREQRTRFLDIRARSRTHRRPKNSSYQGRDGRTRWKDEMEKTYQRRSNFI